jgi:hypothetical protein
MIRRRAGNDLAQGRERADWLLAIAEGKRGNRLWLF